MRFDIVTLFPEMVSGAVSYGVTGKAIDKGIVDLALWNPRDYTTDKYRTVDDRPYGGGPGMVMMVGPLRAALGAAKASTAADAKTIYLSPQGRRLTQAAINEFSTLQRLILVAGRYEGVDERFVDTDIDEEWSLGDYVLSGGELASLILVDAITRLLPGVLGDGESALNDSFMNGLLDYPHYTRPAEIDGQQVPDVLLSGNHAEIDRWRLKQSLGRTRLRRPDLFSHEFLTEEQQRLLKEFESEMGILKRNS